MVGWTEVAQLGGLRTRKVAAFNQFLIRPGRLQRYSGDRGLLQQQGRVGDDSRRDEE